MIAQLAADFTIRDLCQALQVSRSGFYRWRRRSPSRRDQANGQLLAHIQKSFADSRQTYGSPRLTRQLRRQNIFCNEKRVARLMKLQGLRARQKRPFHPRTTQSHHGHRAAPNHLQQRPAPTGPDQAWVADITYLWTVTGWVYLAAVMDLYSRRIVGWSISPSLDTSLVKEALKQACVCRRPAPGLLHHSDRGLQYTSSAFQALLAIYQIVPSMSAAGHCYDNAAMEAFWSTLKSELVHHHCFVDLAHARSAIFDYIEVFYNRQRLHSALGYQSPVEFEQQPNYN